MRFLSLAVVALLAFASLPSASARRVDPDDNHNQLSDEPTVPLPSDDANKQLPSDTNMMSFKPDSQSGRRINSLVNRIKGVAMSATDSEIVQQQMDDQRSSRRADKRGPVKVEVSVAMD